MRPTCTLQCLVDWTVVDSSCWCLASFTWNQPDARHISVEFLRTGLGQEVGYSTPASSLEKQSTYVAPVLGALLLLSCSFLHPLFSKSVYKIKKQASPMNQ